MLSEVEKKNTGGNQEWRKRNLTTRIGLQQNEKVSVIWGLLCIAMKDNKDGDGNSGIWAWLRRDTAQPSVLTEAWARVRSMKPEQTSLMGKILNENIAGSSPWLAVGPRIYSSFCLGCRTSKSEGFYVGHVTTSWPHWKCPPGSWSMKEKLRKEQSGFRSDR